MLRLTQCLMYSGCLISALAFADEPMVLRDLDAIGRVTLSREELSRLLPNAKMSRVTAKGNSHYWKNELDGNFIISSDNSDKRGRGSTAQGKWHMSEDGRYCVLIEWKATPTEEWCRFIVKAGADYYSTKSDSIGTEKVYKLTISN